MKATGGEGKVVAADLARPATGAEKAVAEALAAYGRIDILVNSRRRRLQLAREEPGLDGPRRRHDAREMARGDGDQPQLDCSTCAGSSSLQMKKQGGGAIVNVTSISGLQGLPVAHTYTAAKGAAINLTRSLAITYCGDGIRANCIAPGFIETPMVDSVLGLFDDPAMADRLCPMKRPGTAGGNGLRLPLFRLGRIRPIARARCW